MKKPCVHLARMFLILATLSTPLVAHAEAPLSNVIGRDMTRILQDERVWEQSFEDYGSPEGRDLQWFWKEVSRAGTERVEVVVENLFGTRSPGPDTSLRLPRLYPVKVLMLRYLRERAPSPRSAQINDAWMRAYLEAMLTTIEVAKVPDVMPITAAFREKLAKGTIKINDLSPTEREKIRPLIPENHGVNVMERDARGKYKVLGVYQSDRGYFGIDFAREVEDSLISFAHEMVHAADPQLATYGDEYRRLFDPVLKILTRWLNAVPGKGPGQAEFQRLAMDIVDHIFFETDLLQFKEIAESVRLKRMRQLRDEIAQGSSGGYEPTSEDLVTLRRWIRAAIGLSVENEYRAYGLSVVLFGVLKDRFGILRPNPRYQAYIQKLLAGDSLLVNELAVKMNPFLRAKSQIFPMVMAPPAGDDKSKTETELLNRALRLRTHRVLSSLELSYLEETESFLKSLNNRMAQALENTSLSRLQQESILPEYARPGGYDLPSNPAQFFTARMTLAWEVRFTTNVHYFLSDVQNVNQPLMTLRLGVLDLNDLTLGERKLIGVNYENSPWTQLPFEQTQSKLNEDLDAIPATVRKYFELTRWQPETVASGNGAIDGMTVAGNIVKLRTLKANGWIDEGFPAVRTNLIGIRAFIDRIRDRKKSISDDFSEKEAQETEAKLVEDVRLMSQYAGELSRLGFLLTQLNWMYQVAQDGNWTEMGRLLNDKIRFVMQALDDLGVSSAQTQQTLEAEDARTVEYFHAQLKPTLEQCRKTKANINGLSGAWSLPGPFKTRPGDPNEKGFPLSALCYMKQVYLVRQPGDYLRYLTSMVEEVPLPSTGKAARGEEPRGKPTVYVFSGARGVRLFPYVPPKN